MGIDQIRRLKAKKKGVPGKHPKTKGRTKKKAKEMRSLKIAYGPYLENHPICAIRSPKCTGQATCVHHVRGRGVDVVLDISEWLPSCTACNLYVEEHNKWATDMGFKKSRLENK